MGALRGMVTGSLALIAFETFATSDASQVTGLLGTVTHLINSALSPDVPLIPDRRPGAAAAPASSGSGYLTPANGKLAGRVVADQPAVGAITGPDSLTGNPSLGQYVTGGGLSPDIADNPALQPGYQLPTTTGGPGRYAN